MFHNDWHNRFARNCLISKSDLSLDTGRFEFVILNIAIITKNSILIYCPFQLILNYLIHKTFLNLQRVTYGSLLRPFTRILLLLTAPKSKGWIVVEGANLVIALEDCPDLASNWSIRDSDLLIG